jgi:hypothetical protein
MRITEAGLRKIVREMLKEVSADAFNAEKKIDPEIAACRSAERRRSGRSGRRSGRTTLLFSLPILVIH